MKIEKYTTTPVEVQLNGLTILSKEEYLRYEENIPEADFWWWLRSPGYYQCSAALVDSDGSRSYGDVIGTRGVRPALIINHGSSLQTGDRFKFFGHNWTVISAKYALCDDAFCYMAFRKDLKADDSNVYEASDIKRYLDDEWKKMKEGEQNDKG